METKEHSFLAWPVKHTKLDNGFDVFTVPMETTLSYVQVTFRAGGWHDGRHPGTAHFLEHLVYGGPDREEWHPSLKPLIYRGAKGDAVTSDLTTKYHLLGPMELNEEMARCLLEITFRTMFDAKRVNIERRTILDECRQRRPRSDRRKRLAGKLYPHVARWQVDLGGAPSNIEEIDAETLSQFHASHYVPNQACLVAVGNVDHEAMVKVAQAAWMPAPQGEPELLPDIVPKLHRTAVRESSEPNSIALFFRGPEQKMDRIQLSYALDLLDDSEVGLLFRRLRLQDRLVYSVHASSSEFPRTITIETVIPPFHFNYAEEAVFDEAGKIARGEFPEESFQLLRVRRIICQKASREEKGKGDLASSVINRWYDGDYEDGRPLVNNVTREQVAEAAAKFLRRDNYGCLHVFNDPDT